MRTFRLTFMSRNSDFIWQFRIPVIVSLLLSFIKKIQLSIDFPAFLTGSTKELLRKIFNLLAKCFFSRQSASSDFCKDLISSGCAARVIFSWLIVSLYSRILESFELPAIGFLLLFLCSYFTTKSIEKEAENPVFAMV